MAAGKLILLDKMLRELRKQGYRVLILSQVRYCLEGKVWLCRGEDEEEQLQCGRGGAGWGGAGRGGAGLPNGV